MNPIATTRPHRRHRPLLTVIIVNYDSWPDVLRLVAALAGAPEVARGRVRGRGRRQRVARARSPPSFRAPGPGVRLVARAENGGFAAGVNAGWRACRGAAGSWSSIPTWTSAPGWLGAGRRPRSSGSRPSRTGPPGIVGFGLRNPDGSRQPSVGAFPSLARTALGAVHTALAAEIPGRLANPSRGRSTGSRVPACSSTPGLIADAGRDGRGFLPLLRGSRPLPGGRASGAGASSTTRASRWSTYIPCKIGRFRPRCGSSPGTASCSISASTCRAGSSSVFPGSSSVEARVRGTWSQGAGTDRGRPGVASDRRGGPGASARGRACGDATCWRWPRRSRRPSRRRRPSGPSRGPHGRRSVRQGSRRGAREATLLQPRKDGPACR